jgi:hypothetical protein
LQQIEAIHEFGVRPPASVHFLNKKGTLVRCPRNFINEAD